MQMIYVYSNLCYSLPCNLQKILNMCEQFGLASCITSNPLKSIYVVSRLEKNNYFSPNMIFNSTIYVYT